MITLLAIIAMALLSRPGLIITGIIQGSLLGFKIIGLVDWSIWWVLVPIYPLVFILLLSIITMIALWNSPMD